MAECGRSGRPHRLNWFALVMALLFLTVAAMGFTGDPFWLLNSGTKWAITGGIAVIGVGMLVSALPKGRSGSGTRGPTG